MSKQYTTQELADALGISYMAVTKRLTRAGLMPVKMIGPTKFWSTRQLRQIQGKQLRKAAS